MLSTAIIKVLSIKNTSFKKIKDSDFIVITYHELQLLFKN